MALSSGSISHLVRTHILILTLALAVSSLCLAVEPSPDIVLRGTLQGAQNNSYIEAPFEVPTGIERLALVFHYTGKTEGVTLDVGIEDPHQFRGWSGGNKDRFTLSASDATPSYLPGEIIPGRWRLLIGVPNIRVQSTSTFEADIYFTHPGSKRAPDSFVEGALRTGAAWYRGDLHAHTGDSDGRCNSQGGKETPCPVFVTLAAAARRGLDFLAVTDHNTTSHFEALRGLQAYFDRLLLIPGREITTFQGHANVFGTIAFVDFRVGSKTIPDMNTLLRNLWNQGALVSINHPRAPSGESCMGCGWRPKASVDSSLIEAIEVVNGGGDDGRYPGIAFWEEELQRGHRLTAIGGSDNHEPERPLDKAGSIGSPTTVVYASELSVPAILTGIEAGHVFVDVTGSHNRSLELSAKIGVDIAIMGDELPAPAGSNIGFTAHIIGCAGSVVVISVDGKAYPTLPDKVIRSADDSIKYSWPSDGHKHWLRADVKTQEGKLQLLGNPIYVNFSAAPAESDHEQTPAIR
jgi:hypothetical protein